MSDLDTNRFPISEIGLDDVEILQSYNAQMDAGNFSDAVKILDDKDFNGGGIRASIFNEIRKKIIDLEIYLLNLFADKDTYYSITEPIEEEMNGKKYWIQPIIEEEETE